jgi:hypothetical protein
LLIVSEFVDYYLIGRAASGESGREAIEDRKKAGTATPLGLMELPQDVEALADSLAPDRPMRHSLDCEALGGDPEVLAELSGQTRPVHLRAAGQRREGRDNHRLAANAAGQGFDQP